mgnify:CR=1 FL=1
MLPLTTTLLCLLSTFAESSSCSDLTPLGCGACVTKADITNYECHWCEKDNKCHAIGSLTSACTLSDDCVSLSKLSSCSKTSVDSCPASDALPQQIHIAHTGRDADGNPSGMAVSWFTAMAVTGSVVQYGAESALGSNATGRARSYLDSFGWHHTAELTDLQPSTTYSYRVGDGDAAWSSIGTFTTAPASSEAPVALSIFGDMGYQNSSVRPMMVAVAGLKKHWSASYTQAVLQSLVDSKQIDGVWHLGDIGCALRPSPPAPPLAAAAASAAPRPLPRCQNRPDCAPTPFLRRLATL